MIYVDDYRVPAKVGSYSARWSHMFADTREELHAFASGLGLRRSYFQDKRLWHYDLTDSKRDLALRQGAKPVSWRDGPEIMKGRDHLAEHGGPLRIGVTGSRDWTDVPSIEESLAPWRWLDAVLVSGHARGADRACEAVWESWGKPVEPHAVSAEQWRRSRGAGHARNKLMVDLEAFRWHSFAMACADTSCPRKEVHPTHGTEGCMRLVRSAGIPLRSRGVQLELEAEAS